MSQQKPEFLFKEFTPPSAQEWQKVANQEVGGADFKEKFRWQSPEEIAVAPYYDLDDLESYQQPPVPPGTYPYIRGNPTKSKNTWSIRHNFLLENSSLKLIKQVEQAGDCHALGFRLSEASEDFPQGFVEQLLTALALENYSFHFNMGKKCRQLLHFLQQQGSQSNKLNELSGSLDFDPLKILAIEGQLTWSNPWKECAEAIEWSESQGGNFRVLDITGHHFHEAGASCVEEIACVLATAIEYLHQLTEQGLSFEKVHKHLLLSFSVGSNYFFEVAKLRAVRLLWSQIVTEFTSKPQQAWLPVHAQTSRWNKTLFDPYTNILRATTEAMAAIVGGCDSLSVGAFDELSCEANEFSAHLARNIQHILQEEAFFEHCVDPAAGSYYLENLTWDLAEKSWECLQQIEQQGGMLAALEKGVVQERIDNKQQQKQQTINKGQKSFVGTNRFANSKEQAKSFAVSVRSTVSSTSESATWQAPILPIKRATEDFEQLRLKMSELLASRSAFQAATWVVSPHAFSRQRANFAQNFLACLGIECENWVVELEEDLPRQAASVDLVVFCGQDEDYQGKLAQVLAQASWEGQKKPLLLVAGQPQEALEGKVDLFIHRHSHLWKSLSEIYQRLTT